MENLIFSHVAKAGVDGREVEGRKEATTHAHTARTVGMRLPLFFSVGRVGSRAYLCVEVRVPFNQTKRLKKGKGKGKGSAGLQKGGERRVISWAGELRWRQSSSRCQRGDSESGRGCAFWLFGDPKVRERSDAEWGLARFCRESHCLVADGPTGRLFCDTSRGVFYYSLVD